MCFQISFKRGERWRAADVCRKRLPTVNPDVQPENRYPYHYQKCKKLISADLGQTLQETRWLKVALDTASPTWQRTTGRRRLQSLWFLTLKQQDICTQIICDLPKKPILSFVPISCHCGQMGPTAPADAPTGQ